MKLEKIKDNTKVEIDGKRIIRDLRLPLNREDFAILKKLYEDGIDISGNVVCGDEIIGTYSNAVRSVKFATGEPPPLEFKPVVEERKRLTISED